MDTLIFLAQTLPTTLPVVSSTKWGPPEATVFAAILAGLIALGIGLQQVSIARSQAKTAALMAENARNKLRLELFEKRYALYEEISDFLEGVESGDSLINEKVWEFNRKVNKAEFIFSPPVRGQLIEIASHIALYMNAQYIVRKPDGSVKEETYGDNYESFRADVRERLVNIHIRLVDIVRPDLDVSTIDARESEAQLPKPQAAK